MGWGVQWSVQAHRDTRHTRRWSPDPDAQEIRPLVGSRNGGNGDAPERLRG